MKIPVVTRGEFLRHSLAASAGLAAGLRAAGAGETAPASAHTAAPTLPCGKLGALQITRLILGGNLLTRVQHAREFRYVKKLVGAYNTDAKIRETLELAEANGINTVSVDVKPHVTRILGDHRKNGGKMQWILYLTNDIEDFPAYAVEMSRMVDNGAEAIYIWGVHADRYLVDGRSAIVAKALEEAQKLGVPCGIAAHDIRVVRETERLQLPVDFYLKTLHHHRYPSAPRPGEAVEITTEKPGYWCRDADEVIDVMRGVKKPWIAFKVMAAGAIPPQDAFPYAFDSGADFVLAGMFDFDVAENSALTRKLFEHERRRPRDWFA